MCMWRSYPKISVSVRSYHESIAFVYRLFELDAVTVRQRFFSTERLAFCLDIDLADIVLPRKIPDFYHCAERGHLIRDDRDLSVTQRLEYLIQVFKRYRFIIQVQFILIGHCYRDDIVCTHLGCTRSGKLDLDLRGIHKLRTEHEKDQEQKDHVDERRNIDP